MATVLKAEDVSIRYITGDFKDIGIKEYVTRRLTGNYHVKEFMAVDGVSFALEEGDMLGIIGANGAGKSTLLKAVAGIMEPTRGKIIANGEVAALLELGSGFDGDLTVRENAYLRGAMLGYTKEFMDATYGQIIDFAELREFEDRPFKQLSSGMKSRLAFSIASLVKPDILILDEVLSVGDGAFQEKSASKMREIISQGATTILVSHSLEQIRSLCNKVLWLDHGKQVAFGDTKDICDQYERFLQGTPLPEMMDIEPLQEKMRGYIGTSQSSCVEVKRRTESVSDMKCAKVGMERKGISTLKILNRYNFISRLQEQIPIQDHMRAKRMTRIIFFLIIVGITALALAIANGIPDIFDTVTVRALDTSNGQSYSAEISISAIRVNGKDVPLKVIRGSWYWRGTQYLWKPASDRYKPQGLTDEIHIAIPVGYNREIIFDGYDYAGNVKIMQRNKSEEMDTFSLDGEAISYPLIDSSAVKLIMAFLVKIIAFGISFIACYSIICFLVRRGIPQKYGFDFLLILLGILHIVMVFSCAGRQSFWVDELAQIYSASRSNVFDSVALNLDGIDATPPLFSVVSFFWYKLVPYGEKWLLLLPQLFIAGGIYFTGKSGQLLSGKKTAFFSALFLATSANVMSACSLEFRSYGMTVFFAAMTYYSVLLHLKHGYNMKNSILKITALIGLSLSHYFGCLLLGVLCFFEGYYTLLKKKPKPFLLVYIAAFLPIIMWIIALLSRGNTSPFTWYASPQIRDIYDLIMYLVDNSQYWLYLFVFGCIYLLVAYIVNQRETAVEGFFTIILLGSIFVVISGMYIWGHYIYPQSSMFMPRYFSILFAPVAIIVGIGIERLLTLLLKDSGAGSFMVSMTVFVMLFVLFGVDVDSITKQASPMPYREAAEWIMSRNDVYAPEVAIVAVEEPVYFEYYIDRKGTRQSAYVCTLEELTVAPLPQRVYVFDIRDALMSYRQCYLEFFKMYYNMTEADESLGLRVYDRKEGI